MVSVIGTMEYVFRGDRRSLRGVAGEAFAVWTRVAFWPLVLWWCYARGPHYRRFTLWAVVGDVARLLRRLGGTPVRAIRPEGYDQYLWRKFEPIMRAVAEDFDRRLEAAVLGPALGATDAR